MGDSNAHVRPAVSRRLPTGTVVFLFTDVEGSTRRWESDQVKMSRALQLHDETLRFAIESRGGYVFKMVGDGVCAAFDRLTDAASAAEAIVKQLGSDAFEDVGKLGVRIAIHVGEAYEREGDYFGPTVNRVARLLQIGHPEQIIMSTAAAESLRTSLPPSVRLKNLDEHRLKDLAQPERVFQLEAPGIRTEFPPLRSLAAISENNLPLQSNTLIGRDSVVADVRKLLETKRLVTLTGSGGIGKTRVALQVAAEMLEESKDGVWFVDLATTSDAALVSNAINATLRLEPSRDRSALQALLSHLEHHRALIVLDNCEHVVAESAEVAEAILSRCAGVSLLATSRETLDTSWECVYRIPSLDVPPVNVLAANEALQYGSVMLFVERARLVNAQFVMADGIAPIVSDICRQLDGIALAIELAAARTNVLQPSELASQLGKRFSVLTAGRRTVLRRQQTLRAAIDWSFDLLTQKEKTLFRRLAIFSDGWTMEAATTVCADDSLVAGDVFDTLSSLVNKSLVIPKLQVDASRFQFLESTRLYALEKLYDATERDNIARAHLQWILKLSEDALKLRGKISLVRWLSELEPELENIREALRFAETVEDKPILAGRIVGALASFWFVAGLQQEGRRRIGDALAKLSGHDDEAIIGRLSLGLAQITPNERGREAARHAIDIFKRLGDWQNEARAEGTSAWILWQIGEAASAESAVGRALQIWRNHGETESYDYACELDTSATILTSTGQYEPARAAFEQAATLFATLGEDEGAAISRLNLAELEFSVGQPQRALASTLEAIASLRKLKSVGRLVIALTNAAGYRLALDDITGARDAAREVLLLGRRFQIEVIPYATEHLAAVSARQGNVHRAARLLGYVEACYQRMQFERGATELATFHIISSVLTSELAPSEVARLAAEGAKLNESKASEEALSV